MTASIHVMTLIIAGATALAAVVAVWAGESRCHWFLRAIAIWGCVATMLPIRAYEPAMVLAASLPLIAVTIRLIQLFPERGVAWGFAVRSWILSLRFTLRDILLATLLLGLSLAVALQIHRRTIGQSDWLRADTVGEVVVPALSLASCVVLAWCVVRGRGRWAAFVGLAVTVVAGASSLPGYADWLYALDDKFGIVSMAPNRDELAYRAALIGLTECSAITAVLSSFYAPSILGRRLRQGLACCVLTTLCVPIALVYLAMLTFTPFPPISRPLSTDEQRASELAEEVKTINADALTTNELEATYPGTAGEMRRLYAQLLEILPRVESLAGDLSSFEVKELRAHTDYEHWRAIRVVGRWLDAEAKTAGFQDNTSRVTDTALAAVRFGAANCRGGLMLDDLIGRGVMMIGYRNLALVRDRLSAEHREVVLQALGSIEGLEESTDVVIQRDMAYCERVYGWQSRLSNIIAHVTDGEPRTRENFASYVNTVKAWRAENRLLQTDLAIRAFHDARGRWPQALNELVTEFLPEVPRDPFTDERLMYRVDGSGFILYSVGKDFRDDGGRFSNLLTYHQNEGYDLGLETLTLP